MAQQLSFDLPVREALGRDDFFVASSNALAVAMIDASPDWPTPHLVLTGPEGSGKSHLAHVWSEQTGADRIEARDLAGLDVAGVATGPLVVEDVPVVSADRNACTALFHLINLMRAEGHPLLLTGRGAPGRWAMCLPDLQSRIDAACHVTLDAPDDQLLAALMAKHFADRQIMPRADVIPYLVRRIERSFAAARDVVDRLDRLSLEEGRTLTRRLAAEEMDAER